MEEPEKNGKKITVWIILLALLGAACWVGGLLWLISHVPVN